MVKHYPNSQILKVFVIFILASNINIVAQQKDQNYFVGSVVDYNKNSINGYFDFDYTPRLYVEEHFSVVNNFSPGYYYDSKKEKIEGFLKYSFHQRFVQFKKSLFDTTALISSEQCLGFVIGSDSFAVLKTPDFNGKTSVGDNLSFAEVIDDFDGNIFFKLNLTEKNKLHVNYALKLKDSSQIIHLPDNVKEFKVVIKPLVADFTYLEHLFEAGTQKIQSIEAIIKQIKYKFKYDKKEELYFTKSWDETDHINKAVFKARFLSLKDSVFKLKYMLIDGTPIFEGGLTSFYPNNKEGEFKWFFKNGSVRKKEIYHANNMITNGLEFHPNGKLHYEFSLHHHKSQYLKVKDFNGNDILDVKGNGKEIEYDSILKREITREFKDFKINSTYYNDLDGKIVYQICESNAVIDNWQLFEHDFISTVEYPYQSILNFQQGFILVKMIINTNGQVSDLEILKGLDNAIDTQVLNYFSKPNQNLKFIPAKHLHQKVSQELVIPIEFSLKGFSLFSRKNYTNHDFQKFHEANYQSLIEDKVNDGGNK